MLKKQYIYVKLSSILHNVLNQKKCYKKNITNKLNTIENSIKENDHYNHETKKIIEYTLQNIRLTTTQRLNSFKNNLKFIDKNYISLFCTHLVF